MLRRGIGDILLQEVVPDTLWLFLDAAQGAHRGSGETLFGSGRSRRRDSLFIDPALKECYAAA